ncbi:hypothetical protein [Ornithinicoccus hortensis]|uniref:Uncharacterized protein n=1 Tax=Ornithinicoccus hortensis TaxID=82346 RepID=A0A542YS04_9MICO|nr:hypothetical protein [Ornithinicoccus hortensis]TQL50847.1 hypothetical protein FB467_1967 [Ornithinicoccus hortensis]
MTDPRARTGPTALGLLAALGAIGGVLLWLAWRPTTDDCDTIGECLGAPFVAMIATTLAAAASLVVLRLLHLRPVFLTTLFGFVGAGGLVLSGQEVLAVRGHEGLAPWWAWTLVGAVLAPLAHWVLQPGRGWVARVLPVVLVIGLVAGGQQWATRERAQQRLDSLASVGVDPVLVVDLPGYLLRSSWAFTDPDNGTDYISLSITPEEGASGFPDGFLLPAAGQDPCDLVRDVARLVQDGDCQASGDTATVQGRYAVGYGAVRDGTFLLLTGDPGVFTVEQFRTAVDGARTGTLEELRDGFDG